METSRDADKIILAINKTKDKHHLDTIGTSVSILKRLSSLSDDDYNRVMMAMDQKRKELKG